MSNILRDQDTLIHFSLLEGQARCVLIDSTRLVAEARRIHRLSDTATVALGRLLTGAAIMGDMLKGEKCSVTLTVKGGGEIGALVAVGMPGGKVKGYVDKPYAEAATVGEAVGKEGTITVVKDTGMREPYVGQVELVSGEIAEDITNYFVQSEQIPTACALGVLIDVDQSVKVAGGYFIQLLPGAPDSVIDRIENGTEGFPSMADAAKAFEAAAAAEYAVKSGKTISFINGIPVLPTLLD